MYILIYLDIIYRYIYTGQIIIAVCVSDILTRVTYPLFNVPLDAVIDPSSIPQGSSIIKHTILIIIIQAATCCVKALELWVQSLPVSLSNLNNLVEYERVLIYGVCFPLFRALVNIFFITVQDNILDKAGFFKGADAKAKEEAKTFFTFVNLLGLSVFYGVRMLHGHYLKFKF